MSEQPAGVSADGLESWFDAVRRAERGEVVPVIAHGEHVADVGPAGASPNVEVLADAAVMRDLSDTAPAVVGIDDIREVVAERLRRERS